MSRTEAGKKSSSNDSDKGKLINEIDTINNVIYPERNPTRSSASSSTTIGRGKSSIGRTGRSNSIPNSNNRSIDEPTAKNKKSFWDWKSLKSITQPRSKKFNCHFTLQVHTIGGLPSSLNGSSLFVHWKRKDGELVAGPVKVVEGVAEFEEQLAHTYSVNGNRSGLNHDVKYEEKLCWLYASVDGQVGLDLGKHRVDLTRILPLKFEELEEGKSSQKWTTAYKLRGKAAGAVLNVSFGYLVLEDNRFLPPNNKVVLERLSSKPNNAITRRSSVRVSNDDGSSLVGSSDIKVLHEVPVPKNDLSDSLKELDRRLQVVTFDPSVNDGSGVDCTDSFKENVECRNTGLSSVEKVLENSIELKALRSEEIVAVSDRRDIEASLEGEPIAYEQKASDNNIEESVIYDENSRENEACTKESVLEELEFALNNVADLENAGLDSPEAKSELGDPENYVEIPIGLEDLDAESEFLSMLGVEDQPDPPVELIYEDEPDSPRERLLREFERETEASGYSLFDFDYGEDEEEYEEYNAPRVPEWGSLEENSELASIIELSEEHYSANQAGTSDAFSVPRCGNFADDYANQEAGWRPRARALEDFEADVLMREYGLDESTFQSSPPDHTVSPSEFIYEDPPTLPALGEGLGPFVQTKNGGFLRSMNPTLFRNSKNGGSLIMQVSSPVVVPAEMGSGVMEMLDNLASLGMEKLSAQANNLMPLEDFTGKTMQQIAWEAVPQLDTNERQDSSGRHKKTRRRSSKLGSRKNRSSARKVDPASEYVNLEDLAPLAMEKIEALSIEGLKIQSGMSEEEAPSSIRPKSLGAEGAVGLQLLDIRDTSDKVDGLMGMSLTLDEWMRLDSGEIDEDEMKNERTSKILSAHRASSTDWTILGRKGDRKGSKGRSLFGNNFTVALMVQLRDPLRDYEPVGTPMLTLIQVERVFVQPKQKIYSTVSEAKKIDDDDDDDSQETEVNPKQEGKKNEKVPGEDLIPQYKVAEVHVTGLKTELGRKRLWGSATQQQSGSRWLLANGMGKPNKQPFMKAKVGGKSSQATTIAQSGDTLWSISTQIHGTGAKWKELAALNPHIRNPNIMIPTGSVIRIR